MKIKYVGTSPRDIPSLGIIVKYGEVFEATGDDAKSLLNQEIFKREDSATSTEKEKK